MSGYYSGRKHRAKHDRNQTIWDQYVLQGLTLTAIARHHDISPSRVSSIIKKIREEIPELDAQELVDLRLDQISASIGAVIPWAAKGDKDSISSFLKLAEREAKYLGLDSATKTEVSGGIRYEVNIEDSDVDFSILDDPKLETLMPNDGSGAVGFSEVD